MTCHLVLKSPVLCLDIWYASGPRESAADMVTATWNHSVRQWSAPINLLLTLNYSLNFYLYCLANK